MKNKPIPFLKFPITVKAAKTVVPVYTYDFTDAERCFIYINKLQHQLKIPNSTTSGYRSYLKEIKQDEKLCGSWLRKLQDRHGDMLSWEYVNLGELISFKIKNAPKNYHFFYDEVDFEKNFKQYLTYFLYNGSSDNQTNSLIKRNIDNYFRFMPYMPEQFRFNYDFLSGYCCEDCDGSYESYRQSKIELAIHEQVMLLRKLLTIDFSEIYYLAKK